MAVAYASMISKYLRETLMRRFNAFWKTHLPDVEPTAGYYNDGLRFLKDIDKSVASWGSRIDARWAVDKLCRRSYSSAMPRSDQGAMLARPDNIRKRAPLRSRPQPPAPHPAMPMSANAECG